MGVMESSPLSLPLGLETAGKPTTPMMSPNVKGGLGGAKIVHPEQIMTKMRIATKIAASNAR